MSETKRWEYTCFAESPEDLERALNRKGVRGWELVAFETLVEQMDMEVQGQRVKVPLHTVNVIMRKEVDQHPPEPGEPGASEPIEPKSP